MPWSSTEERSGIYTWKQRQGPGLPRLEGGGQGRGSREEGGQAGGCIYIGPVRMACSSLSAAAAAGIYKKRAAWLEGAWAQRCRP